MNPTTPFIRRELSEVKPWIEMCGMIRPLIEESHHAAAEVHHREPAVALPLLLVAGLVVSGGLARETTTTPGANQIAVGNFNVENLAPSDPPAKYATLASLMTVSHHREVAATKET